MKRIRYSAFLAVTILCASALTQCEYILGDGGEYNLSIDLAGSLEQTGRAIAGAPYPIASYTVTVSAPYMATIQKDVQAGARYINMYIPYGNDRTIRLDANIDQAVAMANNHEHLLSLAGETTVDLEPGRITRCIFVMREGQMKLIIPDNGKSHLVRIPSMNPTTLNPSDWFEFSFDNVYDVGYDDTGRIFFTTGSYYIYAINQITDTSAVPYDTGLPPGESVFTLAIDNQSRRIYTYRNTITGISSFNIRYVNIDDSTTGDILLGGTGIPTDSQVISAIEFENNVFYLARKDSSPGIYRCVYNPISNTIVSTISAARPNLQNPQDILVKSKFLYVTNFPKNTSTPVDPATIEVFEKDTLAFVGSYGTRSTSEDDNRVGYFYGPQHFIAPGNKKIYVIDDGTYNIPGIGNKNRIIAFDDPATWSGWEIFRAEQIPSNQEFTFYFC
ncbi:MAG: hypothetical protein JXD23_03975 [Spirochaetales bacterium]|nr:hypothetical protein [Spirochaetales bacterium]